MMTRRVDAWRSCVKTNGTKILECLHNIFGQGGFAHPWKACDEDILFCQPYDFILFEIPMNFENAWIFC
jgi:hypothetical protein